MDPDAQFSEPRLAAIYDDVDGSREDLDTYVDVALEVGARSVLDIGCGTGSLAIRLARLGIEVTGVDPAAASLAVARSKPGADEVEWVLGEAPSAPTRPDGFDLCVMTGNVAQVFVDDDVWRTTLTAVRDRLNETGTFVLETRDPAARAWEHWNTEGESIDTVAGPVRFRRDVLDVDEPAGLVTFEAEYRFTDGTTHRSQSTLRFRDITAIESTLADAGMHIEDVRDAPDRPGLEFVVLARPAIPSNA